MFHVLILGSVLGSGFTVLGSEFTVPSSGFERDQKENQNQNPNRNPEQEPGTRNRNPNPEQEPGTPNPNPNPNPEQEPGTQNMEPGTEVLWCPMHPNVRAAAGTCKECGMALVPIPDNTGASYWLDVSAEPAAVQPNRPAKLRIRVRERSSNVVVARFDEMHERLLHLFVVSSDLAFFDHVHPEPRKDGSFEIAITFPKPGAYRLVADILPTGATPQTLQHTIVTAGPATRAVSRPPLIEAEVLEVEDGGVRARLVPNNMRVGDDSHVVLELADAKTGEPVTDVERYLGAWGHMLVASSDLADIVHSHPLLEETTEGGPAITFQTMFARAGWYRVWAQVQRRGRLLTFGFTVRVTPSV
jgi:Heavy metal binding domain